MSRDYLRQFRIEGNWKNRTPAPPFIRTRRAIRYLKEDLDLWLDALPKYQQLNQANAGKQIPDSEDSDHKRSASWSKPLNTSTIKSPGDHDSNQGLGSPSDNYQS